MRAILLGIGAALALAGTTAAAADNSACDVGDRKPRAMRLFSGDMVADMTLQMVLPMALQDEGLANDRILALPRDCPRGSLVLGGKSFEVFGSRAGSPVRWAASAGGDTVSYLIRLDYDMRALNPGYKASGWMLVVQQGDVAEIVRAYRTIPNDVALLAEFQAALAGRFPPVVGYDRKTRNINIYVAGR
ncbi:MAG: hypothetical protein Q7T61_08825 [Caulobacter sp.]|nr:hypothetical protein [Caulobacter sp.]